LFLILSSMAHAAEVVWIEPPSPVDADRVARASGASGPPLTPLDLRAAATRASPADDAALDRLDQAVRDARQYEARLDGELVIMQDLAAPIAAVHLLASDEARGRLYAALAYQGFAVDRYFDGDLGKDPKGAAWRVEVGGKAVPSPWLDALALEPTREISPYEIAEGPQRMSYAVVQKSSASLLPASLVPTDIPEGGSLFVDGRAVAVDAAGTVKVPPGRHLAHVLLDGAVIARWDVRVGPGERSELAPALGSSDWNSFIAHVAPGATLPAGLRPSLEALGGEVWIAKGSGDAIQVVRVAPDGVTAESLPRESAAEADHGGPALIFSAGGGWFESDDFYLQSPFDTPHTKASVNAGTVAVSAGGEIPIGPVRVGAGLDLLVPLGPDHVALTGDQAWRPRPYPWLSAGIEPVQLTVGYLFPWHPALGLVGAIPLAGPIELRPRAALGLPVSHGGYDFAPAVWLGASVAVRLGEG
jgi:hypothetical protein